MSDVQKTHPMQLRHRNKTKSAQIVNDANHDSLLSPFGSPSISLIRRSSLRNQLLSSKSFQDILLQQRTSDKKKTKNQDGANNVLSKWSEWMSSHIGSGGFRAAIFGLSDGLATNLCLIIGIQFAMLHDSDEVKTDKIYDEIIRTGIAGIFGGALSMALGEYISMSAQSEAILAQIEKHKDLLDDEWDEQMDILREILAKTLSAETIDQVMDDFEFADNDDAVFELHSKIALGIDPDEVGSGYISAVWSFVMFSIGGIIPLSPYFLTTSIKTGAIGSILFSLFISVFIGYGIGHLSGTSGNKSAMRQLIGTTIGVAMSICINWVFNA